MGFFSKISDKSKYDVRIVLSLLFTEIIGFFYFKGKSIFLTILNAIFNIISFFFSLICKCISIFCVFFNSRFFHKNIFCNEIWCHFFKKFLLVILNFFSKNTFKSYDQKCAKKNLPVSQMSSKQVLKTSSPDPYWDLKGPLILPS